MGINDVEMEDAGQNDQDSENNVKDSESKVLDAKTEINEESLPSAVTVAGNANNSDNGGQDINKLSSAAKDQTNIKSEMDDQTNLENETNEPMKLEGSMGEKINTEGENEEISGMKPEFEEQIAAISTVSKPTGAKNEVIEHSTSNGEVKEEKPPENGVEGENPVKNVMKENLVGDTAAANPKSSGVEDGYCVDRAARKEMTNENADTGRDPRENIQVQTELSSNENPQCQNAALDEVLQGGDEGIDSANKTNEAKAVNNEPKGQVQETFLASPVPNKNDKNVENATKQEGGNSSIPNQHEAVTPSSLVRYSPAKAGNHSGETFKTDFSQAALPLMAEDDDGTPEDQAAFMKEIESFYRERAMDFKPPKFYGQPLNCLKLWRAVIRLGGYDRVTGSKLWRQVGESFHPPKTCTTVSWTFRIFYEKSLLEYERHKTQSGDLQLPVATLPEASNADYEGNGYQGSVSGRARRDAASRAMQGWHVQRLFGHGEVAEPVIKDKNLNNTAKREKNVKSIGSLKQKRPNELEHSTKLARTETSKQLAASVVDVGPPADWVKINVRQTKDCFEVYALVPGLLREERKEYLVLTCGPPSLSSATPKGKAEDGESCSDEDSSGDEENQSVSVSDRHRPRKKQKLNKKVKGREWVLRKKEQMRRKGNAVPLDTKYTARKRKARF